MKEELHTESKEALLTDIEVFLSGYASEKIKYGTTSSGVASDFKGAMWVAHRMVWSLGMSDAGVVGDYSTIPPEEISDELKNRLNNETQKIMQRCLGEAERILREEWKIVERFVQELLAKEELEYDEIDAIFKEFDRKHPEPVK